MTKAALEWFDNLEQDDDYWIERAKIDFAVDLERMMERRGLRKADLAERLGTSPAYITKVMRGDANFTIGSMVRLARLVEGNLHIHIAAKSARVRWLDIISDDSISLAARQWAENKPVRDAGKRFYGQLPLAA